MALNFNPSFSGSIIDFDALRDYNDKKKEQELAMRQAKNASRAKTLEVLGKDIENYIGQQNRIKEGKTFDTEFSKMTPEEQAKFGWISSPEYTEARSVYERTGDPTALNNLRSTWQAQQNADRQFKLQQDQIAANREALAAAKEKEEQDKATAKEAEEKKLNESLDELLAATEDKLQVLYADKKKSKKEQLTPEALMQKTIEAKAAVRELKRYGKYTEAEYLQKQIDDLETGSLETFNILKQNIIDKLNKTKSQEGGWDNKIDNAGANPGANNG